jgi:MarR family transcriptional regulator, organic hydroperoxide resistance regulator
MPNRREPVSERDSAALDDVWRRLSGLVTASESRRVELLERLGLSRGDSRALISLGDPRIRSIGSLADEWQCDASTATRIVDRLEARGLAERRAVGHDRRVRGVALTPRGSRVKAKLVATFEQPPSEFAALSMPAREALQNALRSLPDPRSPATSQPPRARPGLEIRPVLAGDEEQVMAAARLFRTNHCVTR